MNSLRDDLRVLDPSGVEPSDECTQLGMDPSGVEPSGVDLWRDKGLRRDRRLTLFVNRQEAPFEAIADQLLDRRELVRIPFGNEGHRSP